jgi:hypothetical protein
MNYKLTVEAAFVYDKAPVTAAVLGLETKYMLCS